MRIRDQRLGITDFQMMMLWEWGSRIRDCRLILYGYWSEIGDWDSWNIMRGSGFGFRIEDWRFGPPPP